MRTQPSEGVIREEKNISEGVKHILETDLLARQFASEQAILAEFEAGAYTLDNPLIRVNPYLINPCAALALFRTETPTAVTVTVRGRAPGGDISHTFPKATTHILPVLGLYPAYSNTVELRLYQGRAKTVTIETAPVQGAAELLSMSTAPGYLPEGLLVLCPAGFTRLTGFDQNGDIRWFISAGLQMAVKRLRNGRLLVGTGRTVRPPYYSTGLYEMDMAGKIYAEYQLPGGYHHDQAEMPNGDLLVLTDDFGSASRTVEDVCALVDRETGAIKKTWDLKMFLTPGEGASGLATEEDWFHCNAVWYDERTHSLTFSGRHIDALVNIGFETGALNWILGDPEGWPDAKQKYFPTPAGDDFSWQYAQHACLVTPDGDFMCFDNGTLRSKNKERYIKNRDNWSRGVRFRLDTDAMTVSQVWEYGRARGSAFFSQHISNIVYYGEGHYLLHSGGIMHKDGVPVDSLQIPGPDSSITSECVTLELQNDAVVLEMRCLGNYYRAVRLPLYGPETVVSPAFGRIEGKKLGSLLETATDDAPGPFVSSGEMLPVDCRAHIIEESDMLTLKARFETDARVRLLLCRGEQVKAYPIVTGRKFAEHTGLPYLEPDPRNTSTTVQKTGLSGAYAVCIAINGKVYETGVTVTC